MKKLIIISILFISLFGCKTLKNKKDLESTKITRSELFKKADTLKYTLPNFKFKDTTIYVRDFEKENSNTLRITYDQKGNQTQIDCISDAVKELNETIETLKDNSKTKETEFNSQNFIYIFLGIGALIVVNKLASKFI